MGHRTRGVGGLVVLAAMSALSFVCIPPAAASAAASVTELTGGVATGFTANRAPFRITTGVGWGGSTLTEP